MQYIIRLEWFIILVLLQVLVLNHIHFEQYATPLFYIYFLLKIDSDNSRKGLMLWAFSLGLLHRYFQQHTRIKCCHSCMYSLLPPMDSQIVFLA